MQAEHSRCYEVKTHRALSGTKVLIDWVCAQLAWDCLERNTSHRAALNTYCREILKTKKTEKLHPDWQLQGESRKQFNKSQEHAISWGISIQSFWNSIGCFHRGLSEQGLEIKEDFVWDTIEKPLRSYTRCITNAHFPSFSPRYPVVFLPLRLCIPDNLAQCPGCSSAFVILHSALTPVSSRHHLSHHHLRQSFWSLIISTAVLRIWACMQIGCMF